MQRQSYSYLVTITFFNVGRDPPYLPTVAGAFHTKREAFLLAGGLAVDGSVRTIAVWQLKELDRYQGKWFWTNKADRADYWITALGEWECINEHEILAQSWTHAHTSEFQPGVSNPACEKCLSLRRIQQQLNLESATRAFDAGLAAGGPSGEQPSEPT